jgi:hypothetical protein
MELSKHRCHRGAVVFLALSHHPGTAAMGAMLSISLAMTLFCTLRILPALLGPPPNAREERVERPSLAQRGAQRVAKAHLIA